MTSWEDDLYQAKLDFAAAIRRAEKAIGGRLNREWQVTIGGLLGEGEQINGEVEDEREGKGQPGDGL